MLTIRHAIFWLSVLFNAVTALNVAAPYEVMFFYSAYKMEFATVAKDSRTLAPGCTHVPKLYGDKTGTSPPAIAETAFVNSAVDAGIAGICSFDEFLKHIGSSGWNGYKSSYQRGLTISPDVDTVIEYMGDLKNGKGPTGSNRLQFQEGKLLSSATLATITPSTNKYGQTVYPYDNVLQKVTDAIQRARSAHAGGAGKPILDTWIDDAKKLLDTIHQYRIADSAKYLLDAARKDPSHTTSPMSTYEKIVEKPVFNPAGTQLDTYTAIDYEASFNAAADAGTPLSQAQKDALDAFNNSYGTGVPEGFTGDDEDKALLQSAKVHRDVVDMCKFTRDLISDPLDLTCQQKRRKRSASRRA